jgi:hypothetical protein
MQEALPSPPAVAAAGLSPVARITSKRGYADHIQASARKVDYLLASGLPHWKLSPRMVRIDVVEADRWMADRFGTQRNGHTAE